MFNDMKQLVSLGNHITRFVQKLRAPGWPRFLFILLLMLIISGLVIFAGYRCLQTEYPNPQIVNGDKKDAYLNIKLESFSSADRLLRIQANYWFDPHAATDTDQSREREVRIWISKPIETPNKESTTLAPPGTATVAVTATPIFGTPVSNTEQPSTLVSGTMSGEPRKFPFDKYSASIGEQNDFDNTVLFKFNIENHLVGFELTSESGGDYTATITLERTSISKFVIPFVPLFILLFYTSWVTYLLCGQKVKDNMSLVANVALFLSILSLRTLVVPNGIPFGCVFDLALIVPIIIIFASIIRFVHEAMSSPHQ